MALFSILWCLAALGCFALTVLTERRDAMALGAWMVFVEVVSNAAYWGGFMGVLIPLEIGSIIIFAAAFGLKHSVEAATGCLLSFCMALIYYQFANPASGTASYIIQVVKVNNLDALRIFILSAEGAYIGGARVIGWMPTIKWLPGIDGEYSELKHGRHIENDDADRQPAV